MFPNQKNETHESVSYNILDEKKPKLEAKATIVNTADYKKVKHHYKIISFRNKPALAEFLRNMKLGSRVRNLAVLPTPLQGIALNY